MKDTILIQRAISFATEVHEIDQKQKRKGKDIPYVTHPLTVGILLAHMGASDEAIVAGILHDTIEDSVLHKKVTPEDIEKHFGKKVRVLVESVTEIDKELPWHERKAQALEHIRHFSHNSLLVKSADILANGWELTTDHWEQGDSIFDRFNAPKRDMLKNQIITIRTIVETWPENPFVRNLKFLASEFQEIAAMYFMRQFPARVIEYKDYKRSEVLECPVCGWKGSAEESGTENTDSHYCLDVSCPICWKMLLVVAYPKA